PRLKTPLIYAADAGYVEIVSLLSDRGANIDLIVPVFHNALIWASREGRLEVVKLLVARGADVNARAWAVQMVQYEKDGKIMKGKVTTTVVKKDGTRQVVDDPPKQGEWRTPLSMAKRGGHKDVVDFLLASGARE
ncbi:MAG TPA: ankyrin repeat domain-containing protein, partial [Blastocatellia bacterium]|nr:ankyrin repeat domain-containing protein [Blastocatellia bacterium]